MRLRVATYNVHKCLGMDWRTSLRRVLNVMRELEADLISVQEMYESHAGVVGRELGVQHVFGEVRRVKDQGYGNAVFSRLPIIDSEQFDLTVRRREQRRCLRVAVHPGPIQFFAVHLGTSFLERRKQAIKLLADDALERPAFKGRRIVAGDFNEWVRGLATDMMNQHLQSANIAVHLKRSRTYPGLLPFVHLDQIYYDSGFELKEMHWHRTPATLMASDHLPLMADFTTNLGCQS